jgi:hypothetical protein
MTARWRPPRWSREIEMAEVLTFETNEHAFQYACEHLDCSLENGRPVLAIVLAVQGRMCSVKIAHPEDKSIPTGTFSELLAQTDLKHVCFSAMLEDKVPQLSVGDLVLYTTMPELAAVGKETVAGTVVAKVYPHYSTKSGWQTKLPEPPAEKLQSAESADTAGASSEPPPQA